MQDSTEQSPAAPHKRRENLVRKIQKIQLKSVGNEENILEFFRAALQWVKLNYFKLSKK